MAERAWGYAKFHAFLQFPFPYILTGIHALCGSVGCTFFYSRGAFTLTQLSDRENLTLFVFSALYTVNIAISNVSLSALSPSPLSLALQLPPWRPC